MMQEQAASVVDFMRMTCGLKTKDPEKEAICKKFFGQGVQKFKKNNPVAVDDDELRDYAIEIVFNAIEAFKMENIKTEVGHVWRPYVFKASSSTTSEKSATSSGKSARPAVSKKSTATSGDSSGKKVNKDSSAQSAVSPTQSDNTQNGSEQKLLDVFKTLDITAKPTKAGMTGLKVEELNRVCEALGGANFLETIAVVHGKRHKPVNADLVDGIFKFVD